MFEERQPDVSCAQQQSNAAYVKLVGQAPAYLLFELWELCRHSLHSGPVPALVEVGLPGLVWHEAAICCAVKDLCAN